MTDIHDRIRLRISALATNPRRASIASGLSPDAITKLLSKPEQSQTLDTIRKLVNGLCTTPEWLAFGIGDQQSMQDAQEASLTVESSAVVSLASDVWLLQGSVWRLSRTSIVAEPDEVASIAADVIREILFEGRQVTPDEVRALVLDALEGGKFGHIHTTSAEPRRKEIGSRATLDGAPIEPRKSRGTPRAKRSPKI